MTIKILDLFCCAGGAAVGMKRAVPDAHIIGIDIAPQPRYPFEFVQADALRPPFDLSQFDFIWASPKCQAHTQIQNVNKARGRINKHISQIEPVREMLNQVNQIKFIPYIIENVVGAPLLNPILLRGFEFGLRVDRPRLFESNVLLFEPKPKRPNRNSVAVYGRLNGRRLLKRKDGTAPRTARGLAEASVAMGIDWMNEHEITQTIPPVYSEYILKQIFPPKEIKK